MQNKNVIVICSIYASNDMQYAKLMIT